MYLALLLSIAVMSFSHVSGQPNYSPPIRTSLVKHLLTGYDSKARPDGEMSIDIGLILTHMNGLDTINQVLDVAGGAGIAWYDYRLEWDVSEYNLSYVHIPINEIWTPELIVYNSANGRQIFKDDEDIASEHVIVYATGDVVWPHSINFRSQCDVKIQYYPFDRQICKISIVPWNYFTGDMFLTASEPKINTEVYAENGEWDITETSSEPGNMSVAGFSFSTLVYTLHLRRKQSYYILNILLPVVFIAFLGPVVFILPVESGEKAGFALTILLSLSVVMTIVSDRIPSTSTQVALLSVYLLVTFIVCVVEVLLTTITVRIQHAHTLGIRPSRRFNNFMKNHLAPLACYRRPQAKINYASWKDNVDGRNEADIGNRNASLKSTEDKDFSMKDLGDDKPAETVKYTYKEFCVMFDSVNFYVFETLTVIITLCFFLTISIGGRQ